MILRNGLSFTFKRLLKILLKKGKYFCNDVAYFLKLIPFNLTRKNNKKLTVLYLYADKDRYPYSLKKLYKLLKRMRGFEITIVQIDNFCEDKKPSKIKGNIYEIGGDNTYWEFSGWRKGLHFLDENGIETDLILFVNDSFLNRSKSGYDLGYYKNRINTFSLLNLKDEALGKVEYHDELETFLGHDVSSWIRSNIFAVPKNVVDKLDFPFMDNKTIDKIFPQKFSGNIFKDTDLLNSNLKRIMEIWITSRWARAEPASEKNWPLLRCKLIAILNERLLTRRLRRENVKIIDIHEK